MFSLTNELLEASSNADELLEELLDSGLTRRVEIDSPQHFRGHPRAAGPEVAATRAVITAHGASVSLLGAYAEHWTPGGDGDDAHVSQILADQIRTATELGCDGLRIALGTVSESVLRGLLPYLDAVGLNLLQEIQGAASPHSPVVEDAVSTLHRIDHPRLGLLFDISVCTPLLPVSWLDALQTAGVAQGYIDRIAEAWGAVTAEEFRSIALEALAEWPPNPGDGPLVTACLSRFGASPVGAWRPLLPLVRGVHLKFWDADDRDQRISDPIRQLDAELDAVGFDGDFCSEWGGHQWMSLPTGWREVTEAHRAVALEALAEPVA